MNKMILKTSLLLAAALAFPMSANAMLLGRDINGTAVAAGDVSAVFLYDNAHNLTWLVDWNKSSEKSWVDAKSWAAGLSYAGVQDWRLPTIGEFTSIYEETGNNGVTGLTSAGFANLQPDPYRSYWYWTSAATTLQQVSIENLAWAFTPNRPAGPAVLGDHFFYYDQTLVSLSAEAVRTGDVLAVPEPETYALMLVGLAVVGAAAKRKARRAQ